MYEVFAHTADAGIRLSASDLKSLFEEGGRGLFSLIVADLNEIRPCAEFEFSLPGTQADYLLFDWLDELLFAFEHRHLLFCEFSVTIDPDGLRATARGEPVDLARHHLVHEIKAITYHGLSVVETPAGWTAEVIVDI
jgi:SHS2 domain-containing protein